MQGTGAAERDQHVLPRIAAALDRDHAHGAFHVAVRDGMDAPCGTRERKPERLGNNGIDAGGRGRAVQRHRATVEIVRIQITEDKVGIGDGRAGPAGAITNRPGKRAGALRSDRDQSHSCIGDAAAARSDLEQLNRKNAERKPAVFPGVDGVHLVGHADHRLAVLDQTEFGCRAAHIEGHHVLMAKLPADLRAHQHSGSRS